MAKIVGNKTKESAEINDITLAEFSRFFRGPIRIRTSRFGLLRFQMFTIADFDFIQELIDQDLPAREFVVRIIHHELFSPKLSVETIRNWKDRLVIRVTSIWVKNNPELASCITESKPSLELIKKNIIKYVNIQSQCMVRMMNSVNLAAECQTIQNANRINEMIGASVAIGSAQRINEMIGASAAIGSAQRINEMIGASAAIGSAQRINEMIGASTAIGSAQRINEMIGASTAILAALKELTR